MELRWWCCNQPGVSLCCAAEEAGGALSRGGFRCMSTLVVVLRVPAQGRYSSSVDGVASGENGSPGGARPAQGRQGQVSLSPQPRGGGQEVTPHKLPTTAHGRHCGPAAVGHHPPLARAWHESRARCAAAAVQAAPLGCFTSPYRPSALAAWAGVAGTCPIINVLPLPDPGSEIPPATPGRHDDDARGASAPAAPPTLSWTTSCLQQTKNV